MRHINKKKLLTIVLTGFVLLTLTGCANKLEETKTPVSDTPIVQEVEVEDKQEDIVVSGGTMTDSYVAEITAEEVPIISQNEVMTEEETVNYFERIEAKINEYAASDSFANAKDKASSLFITTVDFIFYGGEIKGVTFESLSNSAKLKILNIARRIDTTIMTKWPTYKEDVKTTSGKIFNGVTTKIGEGINYVDGKLNDKLGEESYSDLKDSASQAVDEIKDVATGIYEAGANVASSAKEKIKNWYEDYRNRKTNGE